MEGLYKSKGRFGVGGKEKRKELNRLQSRSKRDDLLAARRNMAASGSAGSKVSSPFLAGKSKTKATPSKADKANERLQRLKEWKQAREEAKSKAVAAKKPVFAVRQVGKNPPVPGFPAITVPNFSTKKTILCMSPRPARTAPSNTSTQPNTTNPTSKQDKVSAPEARPPPNKQLRVTSAQPNATKRNKAAGPVAKPPPRKQLRTKSPTGKGQPRSRSPSKQPRPKSPSSKKVDPVKRGKASTGNTKGSGSPRPVTVPTRHSSRLASRQTASSASKRVAAAPAVNTRSTSGARKGKGNQKSPKKATQEKTAHKKKSPAKSRGKSKQCTSPIAPVTPVKKYQPACPSPLLQCRSASKQLHREAMYFHVAPPVFGDDQAWVPGAPPPAGQDQGSNKPDFEGVFKADFSPFKFGGSGPSSDPVPFQFTFNMEAQPLEQVLDPTPLTNSPAADTSLGLVADYRAGENISPAMLQNLITFSDTSATEEEGEEVIMTPRRSARNVARKNYNYNKRRSRSVAEEEGGKPRSCSRPRRSCQSSKPSKEIMEEGSRKAEGAVSEVDGASERGEEQTIVRNLEEDYNRESNEEESPQQEVPSLRYFRELHSTACDKLVQFCEIWEQKAATIEDDASSPVSEEVLGQIRTSCCQARLLMRQKLKQYIGLVDTAGDSSSEMKTTSEDLQGFWDMVYYQVDGLYKTFQKLKDMESNDWTPLPLSPKKPKTQKRKAKKVLGSSTNTKPMSEEVTERQKAARQKREAQRARLREMRAKKSEAGESKENQDQMLVF